VPIFTYFCPVLATLSNHGSSVKVYLTSVLLLPTVGSIAVGNS